MSRCTQDSNSKLFVVWSRITCGSAIANLGFVKTPGQAAFATFLCAAISAAAQVSVSFQQGVPAIQHEGEVAEDEVKAGKPALHRGHRIAMTLP
jgi:hypothetical protein